MLQLHPSNLIKSARNLAIGAHVLTETANRVGRSTRTLQGNQDQFSGIFGAVDVLADAAQAFGLRASLGQAARCNAFRVQFRTSPTGWALSPSTAAQLSNALYQLTEIFCDELDDVTCLALKKLPLIIEEFPAPFGQAVANLFPNAARDIDECLKCLQHERWTAAVMHAMRILDIGLQALAASQAVPPSNNWNKTLNDIEAALRAVKRSEQGAAAEQWAAEAGTHLRFIKNAHRNQAMHPLAHYDENEAVEIVRDTKGFLSALARHLRHE